MKLCVCAAILSRNTDCYMVVIWLLYDCYMIVIWLLYGCYRHFAHICKHPLATVRFFWLKVVSCSFVLGPWPPTLRSGPQPLLPRATWGSVQLELQGHQPRPHPPAEKARTPLALRVLLATWPKSIPISIVQRRLLDLSYLPRVEFLRRESMSEVLLHVLPMHARSASLPTPNFNVVVFWWLAHDGTLHSTLSTLRFGGGWRRE